MKLAPYTILDTFNNKYLLNIGTHQEVIESYSFFEDLVKLSHFIIQSKWC